MTPERLAEIRALAGKGAPWGYAEIAAIINGAGELLAYVDYLTGALERARDLAVRSGTFQDWKNVDYELNYEPLEPWDEPASDRQVEQ